MIVYQNGGIIKCVSKHFGFETIYDNSSLKTSLTDQFGDAITPSEILNGKWFIVKENEPCRL